MRPPTLWVPTTSRLFGASALKPAPTVRTVHYFNISRSGELIECRCAPTAFYNMVRAMVGTCVYAADGKFSPDDVPAILKAATAPPPGLLYRRGLYMTKLWYQEDVL